MSDTSDYAKALKQCANDIAAKDARIADLESKLAAVIRAKDKRNADLETALRDLLAHAEAQICDHETLVRGGTIWTICQDCGAKWADDQGGFKPSATPLAIARARAAINLE